MTMDDLISRGQRRWTVTAMNNLIDREPAANANSKPLQRGHWRTVLLERRPNKQTIAANACSECGCVLINRRINCPNCNAQMDGGGDT